MYNLPKISACGYSKTGYFKLDPPENLGCKLMTTARGVHSSAFCTRDFSACLCAFLTRAQRLQQLSSRVLCLRLLIFSPSNTWRLRTSTPTRGLTLIVLVYVGIAMSCFRIKALSFASEFTHSIYDDGRCCFFPIHPVEVLPPHPIYLLSLSPIAQVPCCRICSRWR